MNVEAVIEKFLHHDKTVSPEIETITERCKELVKSTTAEWHVNDSWKVVWTSWTQHFGYDSQRIMRIQKRIINLDKDSELSIGDGSQPFVGRPLYAYRETSHLDHKHEMLFRDTVDRVRLSIPPDIINLLTLARCTIDIIGELKSRLLPGVISSEEENIKIVKRVLLENVPRIEIVLTKHGGWDSINTSNSWLTKDHIQTVQVGGDEGNI